jgi:hypothetical protein
MYQADADAVAVQVVFTLEIDGDPVAAGEEGDEACEFRVGLDQVVRGHWDGILHEFAAGVSAASAEGTPVAAAGAGGS